MRRPGLVRTISIVTGMALAIPMAIIGFEFLSQGRTGFAVVFLGLALAVVFLPEVLISRLPRPRTVIRTRIAGVRDRLTPDRWRN